MLPRGRLSGKGPAVLVRLALDRTRARALTAFLGGLLALLPCCAAEAGLLLLDDFERGEQTAGLPPSWAPVEEGAAVRPSGWALVRGGRGHAFVLLSNPNFGDVASLCLREGPEPAFAEIACRIRVVDGRGAQGGGLVWRYRGPFLHRAAIWDPLRGDLRLVEGDGKTRRVLRSVRVAADPESWHRLRVVQGASRVEIFFDGRLLLRRDEKGGSALSRSQGAPSPLRSFSRDASSRLRGAVGLIVPGDARSAFDDFSLRLLRGIRDS